MGTGVSRVRVQHHQLLHVHVQAAASPALDVRPPQCFLLAQGLQPLVLRGVTGNASLIDCREAADTHSGVKLPDASCL
jgi:hypothetical protein